MRDHFIKALSEIADNDPSVMLVNGDLGFGVLTDFIENRKSQYVNAGVAEQNMTAIACGMALAGANAYTYSIGNFTTLRCLEHLRNDVCYHNAKVTAVAIGGGFSYGQLGMSHFATEDLAILRALPNMRVVAPSDPWQAYELTKQIHEADGPTYLRIDKGQAGLPDKSESVKLGKITRVQNGTDLAIFSIGGILSEVLEATECLAADGISVSINDVHTLKPLDLETIHEVTAKCGRVLTVEEHNVTGGLGGAIAEACMENDTAISTFRRIGLNDTYPQIVGDQKYLRSEYGMSATHIEQAVRKMLA